jgi:hypothetical protein
MLTSEVPMKVTVAAQSTIRIAILFAVATGSLLGSSVKAQDAEMPYPTFTAEEVQTHKQNINLITTTAAQCLERTWQDHIDFFNRNGVSKYYGSRRQDYATRAGLQNALRSYGKPESLVNELEAISCIGLARSCLKEGFTAAGQAATWEKIDAKLRFKQRVYGTDLQLMLRNLGWKIVYWNPDPSKNAAWDAEDQRLTPSTPQKRWQPVWGNHVHNYSQVMNRNVYSPYRLPVDDKTMMVGFGRTQPTEFKAFKFFVGVAHSGYHVFPGSNGRIIEAHSMRNLNAFDNLEISEFNPLATGGGPRWTRTEKYRSGLVAVPPSQN